VDLLTTQPQQTYPPILSIFPTSSPHSTFLTDMSDSDQSIVENIDPGLVPSITQSRISSWTCQLPSELIAKVCKILVKDLNHHTLSNLQGTSSAIYTLTTPYLYQHLHLDQSTAISFFNLFQTFPLSDNKRLLHPVHPNIHLVDMHQPIDYEWSYQIHRPYRLLSRRVSGSHHSHLHQGFRTIQRSRHWSVNI
jgi:hypothetical protein